MKRRSFLKALAVAFGLPHIRHQRQDAEPDDSTNESEPDRLTSTEYECVWIDPPSYPDGASPYSIPVFANEDPFPELILAPPGQGAVYERFKAAQRAMHSRLS